MNYTHNGVINVEYLRGGNLSADSLETAKTVDRPVVAQVPNAVAVERNERDTSEEDREKLLDGWMEQVKAFIRNIDVNDL